MDRLTREDVCVAFSGGVDSSLLLRAAVAAAKKNGTKVYAVTISTRLQPQEDLETAESVAKECGANWQVLRIDESRNEKILENSRQRCYWCKAFLFQSLKDWAAAHGVTVLLEGSNADDLGVYRPGLRAVKELGARSPLAELGITKEEVRRMAQELGISVALRPSAPCMATRLPYGTRLDFEMLERLEEGERRLRSLGFAVVRLRLHGGDRAHRGSDGKTGGSHFREGDDRENPQRAGISLYYVGYGGLPFGKYGCMVRKKMYFSGRVQGVGFRYRATWIARTLGLTGWVMNLPDGRVEMEVQGNRYTIEQMIQRLYEEKGIQIEFIESEDIAVKISERKFREMY